MRTVRVCLAEHSQARVDAAECCPNFVGAFTEPRDRCSRRALFMTTLISGDK